MAITSARGRIGRNFSWKAAAESSKVFTALYVIILARYLGSAELGRFSVGLSGAMILAMLGDFGLNTLLTRQVAVDRSRGTTIFLQTAYLKTIFFSALFLIAALWPGLGDRRLFVLLFLGIAAGRNLIDQLSYLCLAYEKLIIEAKIKFLLGSCSLGLIGLALTIRPSVNAAAGALLSAHVIAAVAGLILVARHAISLPETSRWPALGWPVSDAKELLAMTLINVSLAGFSRIDISCLNWLGVAPADIGNYFAAERIITTACLLPGFLAIAALPIIARPADAGHMKTINRFRLELFIAGCLAGAGLYVLGGPIIALIYGSKYDGAARPLAWLGMALPFMFVNHFSLIALIADKRTWHAAMATFAAFTLNILVDLTFIPRVGIFGAAMGAVSAQATVSLIVWAMLSMRMQGRRGLETGGENTRQCF